MSEKDELVNETEESKDGGDHQVTVEELQSQVEALKAEAAKYRKQKNDLIRERDELKKGKSNSGEEDYKVLWDQERKAREALENKVKTAAIDAAVKAKLTKAGILPDAIEAAAKLVDHSMVQWDDDTGVDEVSANAAVAKLKGSFSFMFEKKVNANKPELPAETGAKSNEMRRAEFDKLSPDKRMDLVKKGIVLVD